MKIAADGQRQRRVGRGVHGAVLSVDLNAHSEIGRRGVRVVGTMLQSGRDGTGNEIGT